MNQTIENAKAEFLRAKDRLAHGLATTPDDRIDWSPSPTARTPVQIVAHAADAVSHMTGNLDGRTYTVPTTEEAERSFREHGAAFKTREQALDLLEKNSFAYLAWLDELTPERLASDIKLPFDLGTCPTAVALTFMPAHLTWHTAQLDYVQTIYGDHDWHL